MPLLTAVRIVHYVERTVSIPVSWKLVIQNDNGMRDRTLFNPIRSNLLQVQLLSERNWENMERYLTRNRCCHRETARCRCKFRCIQFSARYCVIRTPRAIVPYPSPIPAKIPWCSIWNSLITLETVGSISTLNVGLCVVIVPQCHRRTDGRTDRQLAVA